jgi:hypothetical protein
MGIVLIQAIVCLPPGSDFLSGLGIGAAVIQPQNAQADIFSFADQKMNFSAN